MIWCWTPIEFILAKVVQNRMSPLLKCLTISLSSLNRWTLGLCLFDLYNKNVFNATFFFFKKKQKVHYLNMFLSILYSYFVWQEMSSHFLLPKKAICEPYKVWEKHCLIQKINHMILLCWMNKKAWIENRLDDCIIKTSK